jgi:hypothetical protein
MPIPTLTRKLKNTGESYDPEIIVLTKTNGQPSVDLDVGKCYRIGVGGSPFLYRSYESGGTTIRGINGYRLQMDEDGNQVWGDDPYSIGAIMPGHDGIETIYNNIVPLDPCPVEIPDRIREELVIVGGRRRRLRTHKRRHHTTKSSAKSQKRSKKSSTRGRYRPLL